MRRSVSSFRMRSLYLAVSLALASTFAGLAAQPARAPAAGPWIIKETFTPPPHNEDALKAECNQTGFYYIRYYPLKYSDCSCTRDAPFYWRLWLETR